MLVLALLVPSTSRAEPAAAPPPAPAARVAAIHKLRTLDHRDQLVASWLAHLERAYVAVQPQLARRPPDTFWKDFVAGIDQEALEADIDATYAAALSKADVALLVTWHTSAGATLWQRRQPDVTSAIGRAHTLWTEAGFGQIFGFGSRGFGGVDVRLTSGLGTSFGAKHRDFVANKGFVPMLGRQADAAFGVTRKAPLAELPPAHVKDVRTVLEHEGLATLVEDRRRALRQTFEAAYPEGEPAFWEQIMGAFDGAALRDHLIAEVAKVVSAGEAKTLAAHVRSRATAKATALDARLRAALDAAGQRFVIGVDAQFREAIAPYADPTSTTPVTPGTGEPSR